MTTIAANQYMMASDSLCDDEGMKAYNTKLFVVKGHIIGFAGSYCNGLKFVHWYGDRRRTLDLDETSALVLTPQGLFLYEDSTPQKVEGPFYAIGTGKREAMAAMYLGCSPAKAVEVSSTFDVNTGGDILYATHTGKQIIKYTPDVTN